MTLHLVFLHRNMVLKKTLSFKSKTNRRTFPGIASETFSKDKMMKILKQRHSRSRGERSGQLFLRVFSSVLGIISDSSSRPGDSSMVFTFSNGLSLTTSSLEIAAFHAKMHRQNTRSSRNFPLRITLNMVGKMPMSTDQFDARSRQEQQRKQWVLKRDICLSVHTKTT